MIIWQDRHTHTHTQTRSRTLNYLPDQPIQSQSCTLDVVKSSNLFWWGLWRALSLLMKAVCQFTIRSSAKEIHWFVHLFQVEITYKREITWLRSFRMEYVTMKTEELILALIMKSFKPSVYTRARYPSPFILNLYSFDMKSTVPTESLHTP